MKQIFFILLFSFSVTAFPQKNIVEFLKLKDSKIKAYSEGELMANDTVVDLKNGYYAEVKDDEIIRQAAVFNNSDGTKTLGVTVCIWDFVCFNYVSNFYNISKLNDTLVIVEDKSILPEIKILDFIKGTSIAEVLKKYLLKLKGGYLDEEATIDDLLSELYEIKYIIPQKGTSIKAKLEVCDYIPTNEITIDEKDWEIIMNKPLILKLIYNKNSKKFHLK